MSLNETNAVKEFESYLKQRKAPADVMTWYKKLISDAKEEGFAEGLITALNVIKERSELPPYKAWNVVREALKNSIHNSASEFEKLPKNIQAVLGTSERLKEWAELDSEKLELYIAPIFKNDYSEACLCIGVNPKNL